MAAGESRVAVKVFGHKTITKMELILKARDGVATLKNQIYDETKIRPKNQILLLKGVEVKESMTLDDFTTSAGTEPLLLHQRFDIFVKNSADNNKLQLSVETRDRVVDIKHKINKRIWITGTDNQILHFGNRKLDDSKTVADYIITPETVLLLYQKITVTVQHGKMKTPLPLNVETNNTVGTLKCKIYELNKSISPANQILMYKKEELNDERNLASYEISSGAVLSLYQRFKISVRNASDGKCMPLFVGEQDTVMKLRTKICKLICGSRYRHTKAIPDNLILMFGECELDDRKTVGDYKITLGTKLLLHQKIQIKVQLGKETPVTFDVETRNTIEAIKNEICFRNQDILAKNQILIYGENELDNKKTVADYRISSGAVLSLHLRLTIRVRNEQDLTFVQLHVKTCDTIATIKRQIFDITKNIDIIDDITDINDIQPRPENQKLIFYNEELKDSKTIADYNIWEGAVLSLHQSLICF